MAEQNFLASQFGVSLLYWIGFTDGAVEGTWQWVNGEAVDYANWLPNQPDDFNSGIGGEDYALMNFGYFREDPNSTGWNDVSLNYGGFKGIIESVQSPVNVPEPSMYVLMGAGLLAFWLVRRRIAGA